MSTKPRFFKPDFYYHIYNCGVEKRNIFTSARDYQRFLGTISFYLYDQCISYVQFHRLTAGAKRFYIRTNPKGLETLWVKLLAYCLMPNHFHLLLRPVKETGITRFISDISNSYTRYFNVKNDRIGGLLQGTFKSKEISTEGSLLQVSRYIHLNPLMSSKTNPYRSLKKPEDYPYSSYSEWVDPRPSAWIYQDEVSRWVKHIGGRERYRKFVESKIDQDPKCGIEDLILE